MWHYWCYDNCWHLQKGLRPGSCQLLFQLSQAFSSAEAAAQQVSGVVQVARGVEGYPLLPVTCLTALLAFLFNLRCISMLIKLHIVFKQGAHKPVSISEAVMYSIDGGWGARARVGVLVASWV